MVFFCLIFGLSRSWVRFRTFEIWFWLLGLRSLISWMLVIILIKLWGSWSFSSALLLLWWRAVSSNFCSLSSCRFYQGLRKGWAGYPCPAASLCAGQQGGCCWWAKGWCRCLAWGLAAASLTWRFFHGESSAPHSPFWMFLCLAVHASCRDCCVPANQRCVWDARGLGTWVGGRRVK